MIFVTAIFLSLALAVGFFVGRAYEYNNAREKLRIRVLKENLDNISPEKLQQILSEL